MFWESVGSYIGHVWYVMGMLWKNAENATGMFRSCYGNALAIVWQWSGRCVCDVMGMLWLCVGTLLVGYGHAFVYAHIHTKLVFGHVLRILWTCYGHVMDMLWP